MEHLPLQAELTLPAREPRELRAACDPARPLAPAEQIALHEDLSAVQGGDPIGRIELRVREVWRRSYLRELVTGHAGCGKSTELLRLVAELRKPKQGKAFHVVYLDAYDYLNPHEVRLPQILIALNDSSVGLRQLFANARQTTIPMVSVRAKPEVTPRGDDPQGIAALRRLLGRRVALDDVFADDEAVVEAVRLSGGCVRDLLRIIGDLPSYGAQPYTRALVGDVAADLINDYERLLQGKPYLGLLHAIAETGEFPAATTDEWKRALLMNLVVLEYDTGTWYDVHPLVKATRAFRSAAPAP